MVNFFLTDDHNNFSVYNEAIETCYNMEMKWEF